MIIESIASVRISQTRTFIADGTLRGRNYRPNLTPPPSYTCGRPMDLAKALGIDTDHCSPPFAKRQDMLVKRLQDLCVIRRGRGQEPQAVFVDQGGVVNGVMDQAVYLESVQCRLYDLLCGELLRSDAPLLCPNATERNEPGS